MILFTFIYLSLEFLYSLVYFPSFLSGKLFVVSELIVHIIYPFIKSVVFSFQSPFKLMNVISVSVEFVLFN